MSNKDITFDVVIPLYNNEQTVERTLKSVMRQSIKPCHVIVVNDGSTDSSAEIVKSVTQEFSNVLIIESQNMGRSCARNKGISLSDAEFVAFIDADDEWLTDRLEQAKRVILETNTNAYASGYMLTSGSVRFHGRQNRPRAQHSQKNLVTQVAFIPGSASSAIVATKILKGLALFPETRFFGEDIEAWCKIAEQTQWVIDPKETVIVHQNQEKFRYQGITAFESQLATLKSFPQYMWRLSGLNCLVYARSVDIRSRTKDMFAEKDEFQDLTKMNGLTRLSKYACLLFRDLPVLTYALLIYIGYSIRYGRVYREVVIDYEQ
jgi:glycosyltransferase involved in cell wall biosynthesis